ncbi:TonB-dependent receptor plug domain-containing protein [Altererythrobacter soli]|uniref:TonB-dependent receptor plug domain-containing protein n=1 Tax=Croceibacterium soli TaxID=1739690 RepID=A0A6I4UVZ6_9SPHN|nr:TonB-dependent receptor plug domain-containing protein [Croceibacterium soli]MXP42044.1 TonB-dependent receptor plug domain-containing protein [Croceibacterium soli]
MTIRSLIGLGISAAIAWPVPAVAQDLGGSVAGAVPATAGAKQVYTVEDFTRFSPRTAYDMLSRVPGFSIRSSDRERGLGQASENVLINGQRVANKSGGAVDELQKITAVSVVRIEILDAASTGIAGLSGQVANVIVRQKQSSGQFEWNPEVHARYAKPNPFRANVSYSGKAGWLDYTLSVRSEGERDGFGGPVAITDPSGNLIETREQHNHSKGDLVTFEVKSGVAGPGSSEGNLTLAYTPYWFPSYNRERRAPVSGVDYTRLTVESMNGYYIDVSGDYRFGLGPGRLKLIGLRHFDREPFDVVQVSSYDDASPDDGIRFLRDNRIGETVVRAEYAWKGGVDNWQVSLERAYNSLDQRGSLFLLGADGEFGEVPYPEGSGHVVETRHEGIVSWSRPLGSQADVQIAGGAEISELARFDSDIKPRKFFRPKGSVTLGWRPSEKWDLSLRLRRRVGQISFNDFLAQPNLEEERENSGNPDLVPPQSWESEVEVSRDLGAWGQGRVRLYAHLIGDIVDIIPARLDGETVGNLPRARRFGLEWIGTLQMDPLGLEGARLDLNVQIEDSSVRDPLSGDKRPISNNLRDRWETTFRHDMPNSDWTWGISLKHDRSEKDYYLTEINDSWEGPLFDDVFIENKNVIGLTVRATVSTSLFARHRSERTVYDGRRLRDPTLYHQSNHQSIGPIFRLLVKGSFS